MGKDVRDIKERIWCGSKPKCDICGAEIKDKFFDAKTTHRMWALMCVGCFKKNGVGVGTGMGQFYQFRESDGKFVKKGG